MLMSQPVVQRLKDEAQARIHLAEYQDVMIRSMDGQIRGAQARGVTVESFRNFLEQLKELNSKQVRDEFVQNYEIPEDDEVIVGVDLARSLGVFEGDSLTLVSPEALLLPTGETPKLVKVRVKSIITSNIPDLDAQGLYYRTDSEVSRLSSVAGSLHRGLEVWLKDPQSADALKQKLKGFDGVQIETWSERNHSIFFALKMERFSIGLFLTLAGLIAGSGVLTVLFLLISQKKRDIAILKTVGMSAKSVVQLFSGIGFLLAMTGVFFGGLVGTGLSLYIEANPLKILPDIYYDNEIPAKVDWLLVVAVFVIASLLSLLGAYIPAKFAEKIRPADGLRAKH